MTSRQAWTLTEAVERTTASRSTIRRYRDAGKFPDAYKDSNDQWMFPIENLLAAGIKMINPVDNPEQPVSVPTEQPVATPVDQSRIHELELALAEERAKREGLERLVAAKDVGLSDMRMALRIIEAPKAQPTPTPSVQTSGAIPLGTSTTHSGQVSEQPPQPTSEPRSKWRSLLGL